MSIMAKKKESKKQTVAVMTEFEQFLTDEPITEKKCLIKVNGNIVEIVMKQHVPFTEQVELVDCVEMMYFPSGELNIGLGNVLSKMNMLMLYTNLTFNNDAELCKKFLSSEAYQEFLDADIIPMEFYDLEDEIEKKVDYLCKKHSDSPMETLFYHKVIETADRIIDVVNKFDEAVDNVSEYVATGGSLDAQQIISEVKDGIIGSNTSSTKPRLHVVKVADDE